MTKAFVYGGPCIGSFETRHAAIGKATIVGRKDGDARMAPFEGPKDALHLVAPIPTAMCGFCGAVFDYDAELESHQPCPHYEPTEGRQTSNPIEAARITRAGL